MIHTVKAFSIVIEAEKDFFCNSFVFSWRRNWQPTPVLFPGKSHGRRNLVGYSPWGSEESDMTERLHFHFMIQQMLEIWSLVPLPFLNPACTSGSSRFMYCWSLAWRILSIILLACEMRAIVQEFEHSLALSFFGIGMKADLSQSCGQCWIFHMCRHIAEKAYCNGTPLQYSCLENPMDGGAWQAAVHGVVRSQTQLSDFIFTFHFHALEKEMATHSTVLAWRIPGTEEPGGLPSMGSHRVKHDWRDLAAAEKVRFYFIKVIWDGHWG